MSEQFAIELSDHFSWEEAVITSHREVNNELPKELILAVRKTAIGMEKIRALLDKPIHISSWYRSPELNTIIGGSKTSQHSKGEAVDFICPKYGSPEMICKIILKYPELIKFDQLIFEHSWVHVSFVSNPNAQPRKQVLTLLNNKKYSVGLTNKLGVPL